MSGSNILRLAPARSDVRAPAWRTGGGWDTHAHVFGPVARFPFRADRAYTPPEQTVEDYLRMLDAIGVTHGVLVQPSVYGTDNRANLDAVARAPDRLVTVIDLDVLAATDDELRRLTDAGARGLRLWWRPNTDAERVRTIAARIAPLRWHLDVMPVSVAVMVAAAPVLRELPVRIVVEAMGGVVAGEPLDAPGFIALLALLGHGHVWVKLSHAYRIDPGNLGAGGPASYAATVPFAQAIVAAAPDRAVWGSDWPHPMERGPMPDDGDLIDLLPVWGGSIERARQILLDNPRPLYAD